MKIFTKAFWAERDMEILIGKLLRYGVMLACGITVFGGIVYILQHSGDSSAIYRATDVPNEAFGVSHYLRELSTIFPRLLQFDGAAIVQFGVCVLIATPVMRVAVSVFAFLIEKDYLYTGITILVLAIILANMIFGLH
ncbi:DUF1634 domain-containing protein [Dysgonomonas sp. 25]|uniref:DUF1634 domain-containing protein n=1 Tax=Dysgonomonas sp. 25 TaxID=2302933 RepID=UPI0013D85BB5|nr:DUF1634 domain-containing protein [Dysgonomonas sp. 25]NDV68088.1 DUF1634 domain-containing protein [Dysgonomonas sp. 25]